MQYLPEGYFYSAVFDFTFGVLSPAFRGCEMLIAANEYASRGCSFLVHNSCELHGTGYQPLECRYCHHDCSGMGPQCHADIEKDWDTRAGKALVLRWCDMVGLAERVGFIRRDMSEKW